MVRTRSRHPIRRALMVLTAALTAAAVVQQLLRPREERTWFGRVVGVPYDFRAPTVARLRERCWAPEDPHVVTPRVFGVGWTLNLGRLLRGDAARRGSLDPDGGTSPR